MRDTGKLLLSSQKCPLGIRIFYSFLYICLFILNILFIIIIPFSFTSIPFYLGIFCIFVFIFYGIPSNLLHHIQIYEKGMTNFIYHKIHPFNPCKNLKYSQFYSWDEILNAEIDNKTNEIILVRIKPNELTNNHHNEILFYKRLPGIINNNQERWNKDLREIGKILSKKVSIIETQRYKFLEK